MKLSLVSTSTSFSTRLTAIAAFALLANLAFAQTTGSGTIRGTVTDPASAAIPSATVIVKNVGTGVERPLATNDAGLYVAQFLQPGVYDITVSKAGFGKIIREALPVQVGQTLTIDFSLKVQATSETVTVTSEAPIVDTEKTEMSQTVSQNMQENLPLAGRRWENFALLTPGATNDGPSGLVSYRGLSSLYNSSAVDGTNNNQAFFSETKGRAVTGLPYVYSMDSIKEFQVTSSNYSAELGQAAGGVINAVTKSGTNGIHGDLFYYLRYPTWNALDPINKSKGIYTQPVHQQQQFGGSVGGQIVKDKLFYFFTYDGSRKVTPITYTSSATFPAVCPAAVSASLCSAANSYFSSQLTTFPKFVNNDVLFAKLDYQLNSRNHINGSFNFDNFKSPNSYATSATNPNSSISQTGPSVSHERIFVASWDSTLSPSAINTVRFQWSRDLEIQGANGSAPGVTITNVLAYGLPNALPRPAFPDEHRIQIGDVLSKTIGSHTIKAGVDFNAIHELLINLFNGGGVYTYTNFATWVEDVGGTNVGDGLTGRHYSSFVQVTDPVTGVGKDDFYDKDFAGFVEDSWKVRPNLTLNLGVRYDLQLIPQPPKPNTATPLTTFYSSKINIDKNNFAPRIGLAWSMGKGTVLRVGYGIFYGKTTNSTYYADRVENGSFQQTYNCTITTCPTLTFPNVIFVPPGSAPAAPFAGALTPAITPITLGANTATARGMSPDWVNPLVHEGEVTLEHALPGNTSISASYLVSRALRLPTFVDTNLAAPTTTRTYDVTSVTGATQSTITVPFYTSRIDPTGGILTGFSDVNSWYNSLVLTFHKRMSHGVEFVANYTLAKAVDGGQVAGYGGTFSGTDYAVDPQNRKLEYGRSDLDQRQRFVGSVVWAPSYGRGFSNKAAKTIVSGWVFSSIVTVATGQPPENGSSSQVGAFINGFPSGAFAGPDGGLTGGLVNNGGTGNGGRVPGVRNPVNGPGYGNIDFRISREFAFRERIKLSLVGDAFNLGNFTNFYNVNVTQYNYSNAGSGACSGHTNSCLVTNPAYLSPLTSNNNLSGARQLQVSGRITF